MFHSQICVSLLFVLLQCAKQIRPEIFPDLSCHPGYKQTEMEKAIETCLSRKTQPVVLPVDSYCIKKCMMQETGLMEAMIYENDSLIFQFPHDADLRWEQENLDKMKSGNETELEIEDEEEPEKISEEEAYNRLNTMERMFTTDLIHQINKNVAEQCLVLLNEIANGQYLHCDKWDPIYNCVNNAVKC